MKRLSLFVVLAVLALASSAHAATFATELGSPFPTRTATFGVATADFNGDGLVDVAAVNGNTSDGASNNVSIYLRQLGGGFVEEAGSPIGASGGPNFVTTGDFNGDAKQDFAVATFGGSVIYVFVRNPGNTGFVLEGTPLSLPGGSFIQSVDVNGDGALDLVGGVWNGPSVRVFTRQGGSFVQEGDYPTGTNPRQVAVGDFNADGRPDLAVANWNGGSISIFLRNGQGAAYVAEPAVTVGAQPWGLATADFNADGRVDVAVANQADDTVQLLLRGAGGGFTTTAPVAVADQPTELTAADFDRNGTADVAVASDAGSAVTVLSGGTVPEPAIAVAHAYDLVATDLNRDGAADLAVTSTGQLPDTSFGTGGLVSLLNTTPVQQPPPMPTPTPPSPTPTPVAPPVAGKSVNATPVKGKIRVKRPGSRTFVELSAADNLRVGTEVDARKGTVEITAAAQGGKAKFYDGIFKISQSSNKKKPLTTLTLTEKLSCPKGKKASSSAAKKKSRKLWGDGKGAFRTSGRYSAATVRGTKWLVADTCTTTKTTVRQGVVSVRDTEAKKTVIVRAPRSYTARKRK